MSHTRTLRVFLALGLVAGCAAAAQSRAQEACGDPNAGLKVDYRNPKDASLLNNITTNHLNEDVENLIKGQSGTIANDLDYVLRNAPNHPRGLYAMAKYHLREGKEKLPGEGYSITCWFDRAMRFAPTDGSVRLIYGIYLHRKGNLKEAEERYQEALSLAPDSVEAHYNLGLLYVDLKRYDDALTHAHEAYRLGYPLPGLKQKLAATGHWTELRSSESPPAATASP
jgi:Tfp pilus assembly protein PilF